MASSAGSSDLYFSTSSFAISARSLSVVKDSASARFCFMVVIWLARSLISRRVLARLLFVAKSGLA